MIEDTPALKGIRQIVRGLKDYHVGDTVWVGEHETLADALCELYDELGGGDLWLAIHMEEDNEKFASAIECGLIIPKTGEASNNV